MVPNPQGLSTQEAQHRFLRDGPNAIPAPARNPLLSTIWAILKTPMFSLLVIAAMLYFALGSPEDASLLSSFIALSITITVIQQRKSEKAIEALRDLSSPRALVIRDGITLQIAGSEVVMDDVIVLSEGSRVAADAQILESHHLYQDESLLTGESMPVLKKVRDSVYSGCMITQGSGLAKVTAIGRHTQIGQIGKSLKVIQAPSSPLQNQISVLIMRFAFLGLCLALLVLLMYGLRQQEWLQGALYGISLSMSLLPEEFTVILTVFLALGVLRIAHAGVLTRYPPVIETLGSINTLCVDKTGTLTMNRMQVSALAGLNQIIFLAHPKPSLSKEQQEILHTAVLASESNPIDPMEKALHQSLKQFDMNFWEHVQTWRLQHRYPFQAHLAVMANIWQDKHGADFLMAVKGAPESVIPLCALTDAQIASIHEQIHTFASQGLRVIGIARTHLPSIQGVIHQSITDYRMDWLGLIGLQDPIRPEVPAAIHRCQAAGIRVVMITGDHALTAQAIAKQAGIAGDRILSGSEIKVMDEGALQRAVLKTPIYVRITPEQKLRLVRAFQANHQIIAMTGDGVNDAPALKAAHVGIAMGERGADVAREAASLVLLHDQFTAIVDTIQEGRRIYVNIRKAVLYVIAIHIPIAGAVFIPIMIGLPPMLTPISLVFLEMMIDPACAVIFEMERAEGNLMEQAPRPLNETIFARSHIVLALLHGLGLCVIVLSLYLGHLQTAQPPDTATTIGFFTLVLSNIALIIASRSSTQSFKTLIKKPNVAQKWILLIASGSLIIIMTSPFLRQRFGLVSLEIQDILVVMCAVLLSLLWFEWAKFLNQRKYFLSTSPPN